jgi:hypothetical protein
VLLPLAVCTAIVALGVAYVARMLKAAAAK